MKIAIIGATGKSGAFILGEALSRGLDCTAIVRSPERLKASVPLLQRSVLTITRADLQPFDVIVSAFGNDQADNREEHVTVIEHLKTILKDTHKRLITVGTAGHLYLDESRTRKVYDEVWMKLSGITSGSMVLERAYLALKTAQGFNWTYMAPAINYMPKGQRSGSYVISDDVLVVNSRSRSKISYADYAIALVDEIERPRYLNMMCNVSGS